MSTEYDQMFNLRFNPTPFDSTLNPHSSKTDSTCNIDHNLNNECIYYDNDQFNSNLPVNHALSLFHLNCRSLNKNSNEITSYLSSLNHRFDIYGFTETWFRSEDDANLVDCEGYSIENSIRKDRTGGGASLFVNSNLHYSNRPDLKINCTDCDSLFIEINNIDQTNIIIGIIYKPDSVIYDDFIPALEYSLNTVTKEKKRCYLLGDFNLDLLKHDTRPKVNNFINLIYSNYFYPCIDRPTRIKINSSGGFSATLIDNILTNDTSMKIKSGILVTDLSDHFPIFTFTRNESRHSTSPNSNFIQKRQLKPNNINGFKNALSIVNWDFVQQDPDPETSYNKFHNKVTDLLNIHCPVTKTKLHKRNIPKKPWVTKGLIKSIQTKDKLYKKYINKPTPNNKLKYTKYRNHLNQLLRYSKKNYISSEIEMHKHNMKKTWQVLNKLLGRNKPNKMPDFFTDKNGMKINNPADIASNFNDFFTNIGPSLAFKITSPDPEYVSPIKHSEHTNSVFLSPTSPQEIDTITKDLKTSPSSGFDEINSNLLKSIMPEINTILAHIFNCSLSKGIVPSKLKIAKVTPVFKAGDKHDFNNYRPISILPSISKILEKIMYTRLSNFLSKHNILSCNQFGFRSQRSTYMAINDFYSKVTEDLDQKLHSVGIFLDLSKAFDTLNHDILIHKLNNYGIRGLANNWIRDYLSNRKQYVVFNGKSSPPSSISCGVPQGSILGPLLFLLYINDLPLCSKQLHFILFADDTNILFSHKDPKSLEEILNKELLGISNWFKLNKLSLNIKKTNFMIFKNKYNTKPNLDLKILIDNNNITKVTTTKFLGVLIDDNLSWHSHTTHVSKIISKYNGIIRKIRSFLPEKSVHTLYNTFILPYLSYCAIIWADRNNSNLDSLFLLQKKSIRICTNSLWLAHTDPLFSALNSLKIHDIHLFQLAIFMYKYNNDMLPPDLLDANFFLNNDDIHKYSTRHADDFHIRPTQTQLARNTIKTQGALLWNSLPVSIKSSPTIATFKHNLKKHLINNYNID